MDRKLDDICLQAVEHYGKQHQIRKAEEEMHELCVELDRIQDGRTSVSAIVEEIADVVVMMKQLALIYGEKEVMEMIDYKIERLEKRINNN